MPKRRLITSNFTFANNYIIRLYRIIKTQKINILELVLILYLIKECNQPWQERRKKRG
jgi:hypothetical protein